MDAVQKEMNSILTAFNDDWEMVHDLKRAHQRSYIEYVRLITCFHEFCNYEKNSRNLICLLFYEVEFFDWDQTMEKNAN